MAKAKLISPDNDVRMRILLAAFVYCPNTVHGMNGSIFNRGHRASDLRMAAPYTFRKVWTNRVRGGQQMSIVVRMLAHRGYVTEIKRVPSSFIKPTGRGDAERVDYQSPVYQLTEMGFYWVTTHCDLSKLQRLKRRTGHSQYGRLGSDYLSVANDERFVDFARIQDWLDNPKGYGMDRYTYCIDL